MISLRQSQAVLHSWSGLLVGWVLYTIFLAGTVSFWREEIGRWTRPALTTTVDRTAVIEGARKFLTAKAPGAKSWTIELPDDRSAGTLVSWQAQPKAGEEPRRRRDSGNEQWLNGQGEPVSVPETAGGNFFYRLHFDLHYVPVLWARWFVGFCAMMMLVAIVSGVITHKKIFKDFFTFRPGPGQRSWLDGHNATAVLALPFHLMITYTGLVTLMTLYMPWGVAANYPDSDAFFKELFPPTVAVERAGVAAPIASFAAIVADAERRWEGGHAATIRITEPGDSTASIQISRRLGDRIVDGGQPIVYSGTTGLWRSGPASQSAVAITRDAMIGLHAGRFAPMLIRWLYFLSGIAGTVMVASGLVLWTVKRREKLADRSHAHFGIRLVERLNVGFVAGLPLAMTGFMWANRLVPANAKGRPDQEILVMFLVWAVAFIIAFARPPRRGWVELFGLSAVALGGLALFDMVATGTGFIASIIVGDWAMASMEFCFVILAATFALLARKVAASMTKVKAARRLRDVASGQGIGATVPAE